MSGLANTFEFGDDDEFDVFACSFRKRMYLSILMKLKTV